MAMSKDGFEIVEESICEILSLMVLEPLGERCWFGVELKGFS